MGLLMLIERHNISLLGLLVIWFYYLHFFFLIFFNLITHGPVLWSKQWLARQPGCNQKLFLVLGVYFEWAKPIQKVPYDLFCFVQKIRKWQPVKLQASWPTDHSISILVLFILFIYFAWFDKILWAQVYIVYLGNLPKSEISASSIHTNILQEVIGRLLIKKDIDFEWQFRLWVLFLQYN